MSGCLVGRPGAYPAATAVPTWNDNRGGSSGHGWHVILALKMECWEMLTTTTQNIVQCRCSTHRVALSRCVTAYALYSLLNEHSRRGIVVDLYSAPGLLSLPSVANGRFHCDASRGKTMGYLKHGGA
jgi:hypothetical protein